MNNKTFSVFNPEDVTILQQSFNECWDCLAFAFVEGGSADVAELKSRIAARVMELYNAGEKSSVRISNRVLGELAPLSSQAV